MDSSTWNRVEALLDQLLELDESDRLSYIDTHVLDPGLKKELKTLLEAERSVPSYLDTGIDSILDGSDSIRDLAAELSEQSFEVDRYKIEKEIGRGGMSVVYLAQRTDGEFEQKVAVKIIQPFGLDREDRFRRLRAERQILANLHHPNIARVFDGGVTPEGWPYMVMEVVDGMPVNHYCREKSLSLNERMDLFMKICDAVIYAHRNLVVHRDLKPGNILISDSGDVKLLDFGIAKLLTEGDESPVTRTGMPLMTPEYAAPEQFKGQPVTTSVDIYSLGVIFFELLADTRPFKLADKSLSEMERIVCEADPPRPSEINQALKIDADLDLICLKALRKEPERRYSSVLEMKDDLERFRQGLPIQARPSSFRYKSGKFIRRNKIPLVAAAVTVVTLTFFLLYHVTQITQERNLARMEAEKANRIKDFTTNLFISSNPFSPANRDEGITLRQVLENGLQTIEAELADDPEIYAELQYVMGNALSGIGDYETAQNSIEKAIAISNQHLGENHALAAAYLSLLGRVNGIRGNYEEALQHLEKALEINKKEHGEPSANVAINLAEIARVHTLSRDFDQAINQYQESLEMHQTLGDEETLDYSQTLSELVDIQIQLRMTDEAESNLQQVIENYRQILGENHLNMAFAYSKLSQLYYQKSDFDLAEQNILKSLEIHENLSGADNPNTIITHNFAGVLYRQMGKFQESQTHLYQAIQLHKKFNSTDSLSLSSFLNNLALTKVSLGQPDSAAVLHNQVLEIRKRELPADNSAITISMYNLASLQHQLGNLELARELFEEVVERDKRSLGEDHPEVAVDLVKLASVYRDQNEFELAEKAFREAEVIFSERFPENHHRVAEFYREYGLLKKMNNDLAAAMELLNKSVAIFRENYGADHADVKSVEMYLADLSEPE